MIAKRSPTPKGKGSSFSRLASYITDEKSNGEKVGFTKVTNCSFDEIDLAVREIEHTQDMNTRAKSDKTYHLIVSFRSGESPTEEQLADIEQVICEGIGLGNHQRLSATHTDTDNLHIHIAINKIHPETLNLIEPFYDKYKLSELCKELEIKHDLEQDNHIEDERNPLSPAARDIEATTGEASFETWCKENVAEAVQSYLAGEGCSWDGLHSVLADYDLQIKPNKQDTGLIVGTRLEGRGSAHMAASRFGRNVSKGALVKQLGSYQGPNDKHQSIKPKSTFKAPPIHKAKSDALFAAYKEANNATRVLKKKRLDEIRKHQLERRSNLNADAKKKRAAIKSDKKLRGGWKREAYSRLAANKKIEENKINNDAKDARDALHAEHRILSWQDFLIKEASTGNEEALEVLRSRPGGERFRNPGVLKAAADQVGKAESEVNIFRNFESKITKEGAVVYSVGDSLVRDEGREVKVPLTPDMKSVEMGLRLAQSKYGKHLNINGSAEFKQMAVDVAVAQKMAVTFVDPEMEKAREQGVSMKGAPSALQNYITERNSKSSYISDIMEHKIFAGSDAGKATYQGQRSLSDGSKVGLFERDNRMLVLPVSDSQAKRLKNVKVGTGVNIDVKGRVNTGRER